MNSIRCLDNRRPFLSSKTSPQFSIAAWWWDTQTICNQLVLMQNDCVVFCMDEAPLSKSCIYCGAENPLPVRVCVVCKSALVSEEELPYSTIHRGVPGGIRQRSAP